MSVILTQWQAENSFRALISIVLIGQTGKMIARVLKGADINNEAVEFPNEVDLSLNLEAAAKVGIIIPQEECSKNNS